MDRCTQCEIGESVLFPIHGDLSPAFQKKEKLDENCFLRFRRTHKRYSRVESSSIDSRVSRFLVFSCISEICPDEPFVRVCV